MALLLSAPPRIPTRRRIGILLTLWYAALLLVMLQSRGAKCFQVVSSKRGRCRGVLATHQGHSAATATRQTTALSSNRTEGGEVINVNQQINGVVSRDQEQEQDENDGRASTSSSAANKGDQKSNDQEPKVQAPHHQNDHDSTSATSDNAIWTVLAERTSHLLYQSDMRRDAIGKQAGTQASSATNWIDDAAAFALQKTLDKIQFRPVQYIRDDNDDNDNGRGTISAAAATRQQRDEARAWMRWLQSIPAPAMVDWTDDLRREINATLTDQALARIDLARDEFLSRIACRLILLPSGASLDGVLTEPSASFVYGKLLYGGVTRYRLLGGGRGHGRSSLRRAGARTEVKPTARDNVPVWIMYGGADRMYEAVDMGPAAILEVLVLPRTKQLTSDHSDAAASASTMKIRGMTWKPKEMFAFQVMDDGDRAGRAGADDVADDDNGWGSASYMSGSRKNDAFRSDFRSAVGGLQPQIDAIVRRVLDGRVLRPPSGLPSDGDNDDGNDSMVAATAAEARELQLLGLSPVRGLLLYGPPGCGKTALAREISNALRARSPKIVAAPELLDRWVGGSEKLVRGLFADAEAELASHNGDATKSALHVVVIDEIDAVFRKRTSAEDSGEATRSSVVNQILAKLDGMTALPNLLLVGMTNRRELLDEALLRPGRLEVQIEVPMPNKEGRREILYIHFDQLRKNGRLSTPLCNAIDGPRTIGSIRIASVRKRIVQRVQGFVAKDRTWSNFDLADATKGFSGADIAGLVRCAGSIAVARCRQDGASLQELLITLDDVKEALAEVKKK